MPIRKTTVVCRLCGKQLCGIKPYVMKKNIRLKFKTWGAILDCTIRLEGQYVGHWIHDADEDSYYKDLPGYPVEGPLNIVMEAKGINGSEARLNVQVEGHPAENLVAVIANGYALAKKDIPLT